MLTFKGRKPIISKLETPQGRPDLISPYQFTNHSSQDRTRGLGMTHTNISRHRYSQTHLQIVIRAHNSSSLHNCSHYSLLKQVSSDLGIHSTERVIQQVDISILIHRPEEETALCSLLTTDISTPCSTSQYIILSNTRYTACVVLHHSVLTQSTLVWNEKVIQK